MKKNEATWDRTTRVALGLALLVLGFGGMGDGRRERCSSSWDLFRSPPD